MQNDEEVITPDDTAVAETTEEIVEEVEEAPAEPSENVEELKKKLATAEAQKEHWRKKASETKEVHSELSTKDILYISKADISAEDVEEVIELATLKKWDISKAHEYLKPVLAVREEERKTARATQTKGVTRAVDKTSGEDLLRRAETTGQVPETADAMKAIAEARLARKFK